MTDIQERFVDEYCRDCNGAAAARRAGYQGNNTRQIAYELLNNNAEVAAAIKERLDKLAMSAEVAVKHLSDVANTRLNDFMVVREVQARELTEQYVTVLLESVREEIELIRSYIKERGILPDDQAPFQDKIKALQQTEIDYQLDILRYGNEVTRLAAGRPVVHRIAELDLAAIADAKELGRIKSYATTKDGVKIEMYAADAAAKSILEFHGKIVQKHEHSFTDLDNLTPDELETLQRLQARAAKK